MKKLSVRSFLKLCVSLICAQDNLDSLISSKNKKSTVGTVSGFVCVCQWKLFCCLNAFPRKKHVRYRSHLTTTMCFLSFFSVVMYEQELWYPYNPFQKLCWRHQNSVSLSPSASGPSVYYGIFWQLFNFRAKFVPPTEGRCHEIQRAWGRTKSHLWMQSRWDISVRL